MKHIILFLATIAVSFTAYSQTPGDTTIIQTLTFDSTGRSYMFNFPDGTTSYEKIIMQYRMRCTDGLVSTGANTNLGCGEWDYSCNTFVTDSSRTDSIKAIHPDYIISSFTGTTFNYTSIPTYTYYQSTQEEVTYITTSAETVAVINSGSGSDNNPFDLTTSRAKTQYLITSSELLAGGIIAGDLTSLKLDIDGLGDEINNLRIKIKTTTDTMINVLYPHTEGFTTVYYLNTTFNSVGFHQFNFSTNFSWDGTSNLIVEFTFNNATGTTSSVVAEDTLGFGIFTNEDDYSLEFSGAQYSDISGSFSTITDEITISLWSYGDISLPQNTYLFEGVDAANNRQVNVHLPWNNGSVYWDCGNTGSGYDRIDKAALASDYQNKWTHWTFTKNAATGSMKIYLNGVLWHSGTGKTNPINLQQLVIGASKGYATGFLGKIDEFQIWDKELSSTEIMDYMHTSITAAHPSYSNLVAYYKFNTGSGLALLDETGNHNGTLVNGPLWRQRNGEELAMNFVALNKRPNFVILQGTYSTNIIYTTTLDSLINGINTIDQYAVDGTDVILINSSTGYEAGDMVIYDEDGNQVGTVAIATQNTINIVDLDYYKKFPSQYELMSFVTPYGINLNLGIEGKMWEFDVSDFQPILKNNKLLSVQFGATQEELDIRFLFIEGTPSREVIDIQNIWRSGQSTAYGNIISDSRFEPRTVSLNPSASMFKIKAAITGHGQEGEFIARTHYFNLNGGFNEVEWQVWKECAENPVYPQGGTWVYDRAGWCPGWQPILRNMKSTQLPFLEIRSI
ncbi:MAG: hypothetical protein JKY53_10945 [Flavobacteriales bacterium]|nr:hypothetical protein [Flavobacteriales bacterium]